MTDAASVVDLTALLEERREEIVARFVAETQRQDLPPAPLQRSLLVDHIPRFLDDIVAELGRAEQARPSQDAHAKSPTARQHGGQRWDLGYDLEALIREYGILRSCILQVARDTGTHVSIDQVDILAKCLNVGVAEAATAYARHRDGQLDTERANLEFLTEAGGLLSSSLDYRSTLAHLTRLLVPRLADWCAIHLEGDGVDDMAIGHVDPAKVATLRDIYRKYPLPSDSPYGHEHVMRTGTPQVMPRIDPGLFAAAARSPEHLAMLRSINSCSWMMVPLLVQDSAFGVITFAYSDSGRHYDDADLALAGDIARRAAVAIDNARLYRKAQEERSRVEAATRAKDEFVAMITHELRTPMNAILGWLQLLRGGTLTEEKQLHALKVIERNARAQNQLIADLIDISAIVTGKLRLKPSQVDVSNLVEMAIEGIRPAADAKRIAIEANLERFSTVVRADGERVQQVVWNLLSNAVKFTPKSGRIDVQLRRVESDIELTVKDTGEGIAAEFIPHMFETFRQSDTTFSRPHGGLGIGLSIAKYLVELHGGSIVGHSAGKGQGATFVVRIPVSPLVSATLGISSIAASKPSSFPPAVPRLDGMRVLVVDDEPDAVELIAELLEECGIEVRTANSVAEALAVLGAYDPHMIISDIGMPDEDGYALIRSVRTHGVEAKRNIPAIALTAFTGNGDRAKALVAGFNRHIAKPVDAATLIATVVEVAGPLKRDESDERA